MTVSSAEGVSPLRKCMEDFAKTLIRNIVQDVRDLPDRNNSEDQPGLMQVSADELELVIRRNLFEPR